MRERHLLHPQASQRWPERGRSPSLAQCLSDFWAAGTLEPSRPSNPCNEKAKRCKASCGAIASLRESHENLWNKIPKGGDTNAIPDCSCCRLDDGAVCANHCAMFKRARMAIIFSKCEVTLRWRLALRLQASRRSLHALLRFLSADPALQPIGKNALEC
jgi:hypothetical protein